MNAVSQFSSENDDPLVQERTVETNVSCTNGNTISTTSVLHVCMLVRKLKTYIFCEYREF